MLSIVKHLCQVVVVGYAHRHGIRIGLTEIGLCVVSQIESMLVPVERICCWRIFYTVDMALGVGLLLEEFPSTTRYLVGTWRHVRLTDTDERARQHNLRSLDVLDIRNTALENDVDVHYVALADRSYVCTRSITLLVVVFVNDGDNLLLREVEDVREAAYIQRAGLCGSDTVDAEVLLPVGQLAVVVFCDKETYRHLAVYVVSTGLGSTFTSNTSYSDTFGILTHLIAFAAVVVFIVHITVRECQRGDICLIGVTQASISACRNDGAHSVG